MKDIKAYEAMAKLDLPEEERRLLSLRAERLMRDFQALDDADVSGVEPMTTVLDVRNVMREDAAEKLLTRDELLSGAPERYEGYFQVPKTLA